MKKLAIIVFTLIFTILFFNCGGNEAVPIKSLKTYEDPVVKFTLDYPENWETYPQKSVRFICFSSPGVKKRYPRYKSEGVAGAKIEVFVLPLDSNFTIDSVLADKTFQDQAYSPVEKVTIDGVQGYKQAYGFKLKDGPFYGEKYMATKDNKLATIFTIEAFAGTFDEYKKDFDKIIKSFKLAEKPAEKVDTQFVEVEADPPSSSLRTVNGDGFTLQIPDNFNKEGGLYIGQRRGDSFLKVDVFPAEKTEDFNKLVKENQKKLRGAGSINDLTINGEKAKKVSYKPSSKVSGEMYFILKNKKLYRLTINWFSGDREEEKLFKPILQKCALTLDIK